MRRKGLNNAFEGGNWGSMAGDLGMEGRGGGGVGCAGEMRGGLNRCIKFLRVYNRMKIPLLSIEGFVVVDL